MLLLTLIRPMVITMFSGTIGSGKSYHALEEIIEALDKGKYVIANFPLNFAPNHVAKGWADRYMYVDDRYFQGVKGIRMLLELSRRMGWDEDEREGLCHVFIDEATNFFPKEDNSKPEQKLWKTFFTQSRKLGYDFTLILQDDNSINKTIGKCIEYDVKHRKANNIFPFSLLNMFKVTIFFYNVYWKQQRVRLRSDTSMFSKRIGKLYHSKKMFANLDADLDKIMNEMKDLSDEELPPTEFGNCTPNEEVDVGWGPNGAGTNVELEESEKVTEDEAS
ncbi:zonular occludens toxin domain-containing protein [Paenibacillus odorifer]|uniref:zonular occludens toxin domain-containing protein n=1 Tax=Paenibacillus odorifer TaxID=189426 RepID=UPI0020BE2842|nr:zonular occludens toxin domain-containing protein [Paenibacillus odorifer]